MIEVLFGLVIALVVLALIGHGLWLLAAAILKALLGEAPSRSARRIAPRSEPPSGRPARVSCPICTAPIPPNAKIAKSAVGRIRARARAGADHCARSSGANWRIDSSAAAGSTIGRSRRSSKRSKRPASRSRWNRPKSYRRRPSPPSVTSPVAGGPAIADQCGAIPLAMDNGTGRQRRRRPSRPSTNWAPGWAPAATAPTAGRSAPPPLPPRPAVSPEAPHEPADGIPERVAAYVAARRETSDPEADRRTAALRMRRRPQSGGPAVAPSRAVRSRRSPSCSRRSWKRRTFAGGN